MGTEIRSGRRPLAGYDIAYRVGGHGSAVVLVKPHRRPKEYPQLRHLANRYRTIQIEPFGFGASDRPAEYPRVGLAEQILAVADHELVDRFVVWGYSKGAAMAAVLTRASPRVAALVAGGFSLVDRPTEAHLARMDREQRVPVADRAFWHCYKRYDWYAELAAMRCPALVYVGGDDRTFAPGVRRMRAALPGSDVAFIEFDGLDHQTCNDEPAMSARIVPILVGWLADTIGTNW